ncbi:MAG TPA: PAS domain S-box protein [Candidatus Sulfopaludibacter sp.]|jgi:PAS domain S-box-containing protein|nr:PAS domain S-box protein [Candidatus Sulfopaludibacter sp.]
MAATNQSAPALTAEEAVAHLAAIVESSDDAIISKTLEGVILSWNSGAERIYGYPADEIIGRQMTLLLPPNRPNEEALILEQIRRGERVDHFETVRRTRQGDLITVSITISPIRDAQGVVIGASHVARNVSDRKRIEEQLNRVASIVESSDDAIVSKTLDGMILTWNRGAESLYGYPAAEAIGRSMTLLIPEDRPNEEADILDRIRRGERVHHFETVRRTKNGKLIDVSVTISPVYDQTDRIIGASHVARDVTERKQLEEQMRHTQKLESLGVLAGGVAHDFNNLLTGIMGNASLALEILATHDPVCELIRDVVSASDRAAHLTRQLLAYAGKGRFLIEPLDVSEQVREISHLVQTSISKNVNLRLELDEGLPPIQADASQLQQVVMNLVINGAEAIPPDRNGTVLVTTGIQHVDVPELPAGDYVSLEVSDTGIGMNEETLARIFDPFFTTKFTGRGLGLAAVQGIVRSHRGALKVHSRPGGGTTFQVMFPAVQAAALPKPPVVSHVLGGRELILVIDDEDVIRRTARASLERYGYTVAVAENGAEGVKVFQVLADNIAVVILDMTMPVMGGEEAFRQIKLIRPDARILLSSGYNEVEAVRRFTGKGLAGFIQKPYSSAILVEKVKSVIEAHAA